MSKYPNRYLLIVYQKLCTKLFVKLLFELLSWVTVLSRPKLFVSHRCSYKSKHQNLFLKGKLLLFKINLLPFDSLQVLVNQNIYGTSIVVYLNIFLKHVLCHD